ncbi:hypothetical protein H4R34_005504 [Dimargaris verticillata]|uniref:F-box domain-containing protein n=1 Tax=Dimargaris verticillata TaxID=2761393 RepID=A0A9W8B250_9FUNG|nr:hypothetical protein H4R34_005504 [Dimargaris verticillata]
MALAQPALPTTLGSDAVEVDMRQLNLQDNLQQARLATIEDLPLEMGIEILNYLDPMNLKAIITTNHQFNAAATMVLALQQKAVEAQYQEDPTIPNDVKQQYQELQQTEASAAQALLNNPLKDTSQLMQCWTR